MFRKVRRNLSFLLAMVMLFTAVYAPCAEAAQKGSYSTLWSSTAYGWKLQEETGEAVKASWVCDDEIAENGKNTWYLIDENGLLITDRLIHVTYDGTDGYYLLNRNRDGHFGAMIYEDGVYDGVDVQFSQVHDGSFGRIINLKAVEELKKRLTVKEVSFVTKSSDNRYTSVIRSRLSAASGQDQYDDTERQPEGGTEAVHVHHYDGGGSHTGGRLQGARAQSLYL